MPTRVIFEGLKLTVGIETIFTIVELKKPSIEIEREVFVVVALFLYMKGRIWREQNKKRDFCTNCYRATQHRFLKQGN